MEKKLRKNIKLISINKLREYEKNNKNHPEEQISLLVQNIDRFGFTNPLLIDKDYIIIAGHCRLEAAKRLNYKELPCLLIDDLTKNEIKALRISDNRISELAETNWDFLKEEYLSLKDEIEDLQFLTGYDLEELSLDSDIETNEDDFEPPIDIKEIETNIKKGDIIKLGNHTLMCGDTINPDDVKSLMKTNKAKMVFTDPPWNVNYGSQANHPSWKKRSIKNDNLGEDFGAFIDKSLKSYNLCIEEGAMIYIVMSAQEWGTMMNELKKNDYHWSSTIIWCKDSLVLSRKDYHTQYEPIWYGWKGEGRNHPLKDRTQSDVWNIPRPKKSEEHPTMKPIELVARAIKNSSQIGDNILDLFGGSGTTLIAAEQTKRTCYMMELDEKYCEVICQRWEKLTGKKRGYINKK